MLYAADLKVLIVSADSAKEIREALHATNVKKVTVVKEVAEADQVQELRSFHLLVTDDGNEGPVAQLKAIKGYEALSALPVMLLTSCHETSELAEAQSLLTAGLLRRPVDAARLKAFLRLFMRKVNSRELSHLLKHASFFCDFTAGELKQLLEVASIRHYTAGETIISKDDAGDSFFVLLRGGVEVLIGRKNEPILQIPVSEGFSFGEMALLDPGPRTAYCIATTESEVIEIGAQLLENKQCTLRNKVLAQLSLVLAGRIRAQNHVLEEHQARDHFEEAKIRKQRVAKEDFTCEDLSDITPEQPSIVVEDIVETSPLSTPKGMADHYDTSVGSQEDYDVLTRKIHLRSSFIIEKVPRPLRDMVANKLVSYWTGGKLARHNPHKVWSRKLFSEGSPRLLRALHLVVLCPYGKEAFERCYLDLPLSHRVIGLPSVGCTGSFLATDLQIDRYLDDRQPESAISYDMRMPIERMWKKKEVIEFLTHSTQDVRDETLFVVYDSNDGRLTQRVRDKFPSHQLITVVNGVSMSIHEFPSAFSLPEKYLKQMGQLVEQEAYQERGFYFGQTLFLPDISGYFDDNQQLCRWGHIFGTIATIASIGPDYTGVTWGSKGGAEGAIRAAKARYGLKGAASATDIANAINWADG